MFPAGRNLLLGFLCACLGEDRIVDANEVTFELKTTAAYDTQPKLRIKGSGFQAIADNVDDVKLTFSPPFGGDDVFNIDVKSDTFMNLELDEGKRWISSDGSPKPKDLFIEQVSLRGEDLLTEPVQIARLVPTPTVQPSTNIVYLTASPFVSLNGTNFNEKHTHLYFVPPLEEVVDVSISIKSSTSVLVTLLPKASGDTRWADEPGPLKLVAIDTGAGKLLLREELGGVTVAELQADMKGHGISVESHDDNIKTYQSTAYLTVAGTGFNPAGTKFRFGNTLVLGTDYTVDVTKTSATFTLAPGSLWQKNVAILPCPLLLLAADAGDGYVPLGATTAKAGRKVAMVFEDPSVEYSDVELRRTMTHELVIQGTGFTRVFPPLFVFDPHIDKEDYLVHVENRTHVKVVLAGEQSAWMPEGQTGELFVRAVNSGAGVYTFDEAVQVAVVVSEGEQHHSGIVVHPSYAQQMYQSSGTTMSINGEGFPLDAEVKLGFGFAGPDQGTISCSVKSASLVEVVLLDDFTWLPQGGPLFLYNITFGEHVVKFDSPGLKVATILDDPFVQPSELQVYASHTKHMTLQGHGFVSWHNPHFVPKVILSPTEGYTVLEADWTSVTITISLKPDMKWAEVSGEDVVPVAVVSIDTGAGPVVMAEGGVVVASVRADDDTFSCDDSCVYANDGQCDEDQGGEDVMLQWSSYEPSTNGYMTDESRTRGDVGSYVGGPNDSMMDATDDLVFREAPSCQMGTDCTDCGRDMVHEGKCTNTCRFARDGDCDDRRSTGVCPDGTDCQDCGPWGSSNFTEAVDLKGSNSIEPYDDDDSSFLADNNHPLLVGQRNNGVGQYKRVFVEHAIQRQESEEAESVFMETLWAAIVFVGFSVVMYTGFLVLRCMKGEAVSLDIPTNPDVEHHR